jgi:signal recognition particle receptor subunit beta
MWEILSEACWVLLLWWIAPPRPSRNVDTQFRAYAPTPFVVAANKQDMEDAWEMEDVRHALRLDANTKLLPCIAIDRKTVKTVLLELLYSIMQEMDSKK